MGLFNVPVSIDKRLFLTSDTQSRITVSGPEPDTALNIQLKGFESFTRTTENVMFADPVTGLLRLPDAGIVRFEVNGLLLEPEGLIQYIRNTDFDPSSGPLPTSWTESGGIVVSVPTGVDPTGTGAPPGGYRVLSNITGTPQYIQQIITSFDPSAQPYRFSVFMKPLPPATVPDVKLYVNYSGGSPVTIEPVVVVDPTSDWLRYDIIAFNSDAGNTTTTVRIYLQNNGEIAVWGVNFTESNYLASYRPRALETLAPTGGEHLIYDISAMGIEPATSQDFTVLWEFIPLGAQGDPTGQAPSIAFAGGDSSTGPAPPQLYEKTLSFGAHTTLSQHKLAIIDSTQASPSIYTHSTLYDWDRYSHQKWAFVVYWDGGSQKCRFFANGTYLGETTISGGLTADNYTKFVLPQAAIHRRIETLAEALSDDSALSATTIL